MTFTHLEVHSHLTLLGATPSPPELAARARADGMTHLALTDTNALYGVVAFARACRDAQIHPIIGMTVTVAEPDSPASAPAQEAGHLVLLATGPEGYRSLCRLSSLIQGSPDRVALAARGLAWDQIAAHRDGLICLSGGRMGWLERFVRRGDSAAAQLYAGRLAGIFDEDAFLALELHAPQDERVAAEVVALGRRLGMPTVAVQPVYCLATDDTPRLRLLAAIRENRRLYEPVAADEVEDEDEDVEFNAPRGSLTPGRPVHHPGSPTGTAVADRLQTAEGEHRAKAHWLSPAEIADRYARFPQAIDQAGKIAARCGEALPAGRPIWPALKLPPGQTPDGALADLAAQGLQDRYPTPDAQHVRARLDRELSAIAGHGYAPLFLVVADIVRFAREQGIPVSTRGSVANSLAAYCTGITTVDPIQHDLLFERFLNPARANPPDIDLDFCSRRRDEVLRYVREKYGADRVALVCTFSTMRPQSAVREVGKAYGLPEADIDRLAKLMPGRWHPDPRRRDRRKLEDVLPQIADPRQREVLIAAASLIGQPDHLSVHPGALVITPGPLTDVAPVQWAPKGFLVTQFEHGDVEAIGLPKMDLLGIRALTVLADAAELVRLRRDPGFRLEHIPLDDAATGEMLARGETIGVFQCESEGAQRTLRKLHARTVTDLAIANAFFKPGPAMGGMADAFVRRYRGQEAVSYLHPALKPILGPTKGVLIFQEQVLRLATEIAGLDWTQADQIRRGMSHFGPQEMEAVRELFEAGCRRRPPDGPGFTPVQAHTLWEQIMPFAGYGFNQGHATAYAGVSYRSAYLKAHHPAEFLCARLADWGGFHHPAIYAAEAVRLGIAVRPPHVNFSGEAFTLVNQRSNESANQRINESANQRISESANQRISASASQRIPHTSRSQEACDPRPPVADRLQAREISSMQVAVLYMGLGQVRDLRGSSSAGIVAERARGPYADLRDLLSRVDLQPKEVDHLIRCGALDGLGESRAALLAEAEMLGRKGGASQLAFDFARPRPAAETAARRLAWEQELLGWPVSVHPLALVSDRLPDRLPLRHLPQHAGKNVTVAGARLPGWTGGQGFFLGDGDGFVIVKAGRESKAPPPWRPLLARGRWVSDAWGGAWFQAEAVEPFDTH